MAPSSTGAGNSKKVSNKKKNQKHVGFTKEALAKGQQKPTPASHGLLQQQQIKPGVLSKGQLSALIMLSLGISRVLKLGAVVGGTAGSSADEGGDGDSLVVNDVCVQHLGDVACRDGSVLALLRYKYYSAVQLTIVAVAIIVQCWNTELLLQTLDVAFVFAPISASVAAMVAAGDDGIHDGKMQNGMMAIVLAVLALPTEWNTVPFFGMKQLKGRRSKTLQTLCLLTLAMFSMYEGLGQILFPMVLQPRVLNSIGGMDQPLPLQQLLAQPSPDVAAQIQPAVNAVLYLIVVDKITHSLLYLFAWFYFPNTRQRVRP